MDEMNNSYDNCSDNQFPEAGGYTEPRKPEEAFPAEEAPQAEAAGAPVEPPVDVPGNAPVEEAAAAPAWEEPRPQDGGAYRNAGAGRKESPFANSPYETAAPRDTQPTGDWQTAYIPPEAPPKKAKKEKQPRKGRKTGRVVAAALACAILGGVGGGALSAHLVDNRWEKATAELQASFESQLAELGKNTGGGTLAVSTVSSGEYMTPAQVYQQNVQSVVAVTTKGVTSSYWGQQEFVGTGSGFILTSDGYVLTNYHVVEGGSSLTVTTYDGTEYPATLIGSDSFSDVALLKVDAEGLPAVVIGDSDSLNVGDQVAAIGNPLGELTSSQTVGYISAKDRTVDTDGTILNMLQTDAAINSGNSGGPLFNMYGEVVGITTAKYSGSTSSGASIEGIGFAIPINDVMDLVNDLMEYGYITGQAYLGVTVYSQDLDANTAAAYGLPVGARIESVTTGSCAEAAGVQAGDIITALDDQEITGYTSLAYALRSYRAGDTATLTVFRGGQTLQLTVTFDEKTSQAVQSAQSGQEDEESQSSQPQPNGEMPESGNYEDWYEFFAPFFGTNP